MSAENDTLRVAKHFASVKTSDDLHNMENDCCAFVGEADFCHGNGEDNCTLQGKIELRGVDEAVLIKCSLALNDKLSCPALDSSVSRSAETEREIKRPSMAQASQDQGAVGVADPDEDSPNMIAYRKMPPPAKGSFLAFGTSKHMHEFGIETEC
ncbi:hypothetical protein cypCar_00009648 [Cyprinus carpio]|nr:hypothetical protein cypCar_00009648 [Cyprinus carpio]